MLAVLVGAGLLRTPPRARAGWIGAVAALVGALVVTAAGVKTYMHARALYPDDDFARVARHVLDGEDARPTIVFVGTSMSRQGLDDEAVTAKLNAAGWNVRVASLSLQGSSQHERDMHLRQYLRAAAKPPVAVYVEIAPPTDTEPTYGFKVAKFSTRAIKQFGPRATYWSVRGLIEDRDAGLVSWVKDTGGLGLHVMLNLFNVGALRDAAHISHVTPLAAYEPFDTPRIEPPSAEVIAEGLAGSAPAHKPTPDWARAFREHQAMMLEARGVGRVGFYAPLTLEPDLRAYGTQACAAQIGRPCLNAEDPDLRSALTGPHWNDRDHMLASGAALQAEWLAGKLLEARGAIEAGVPTPLDDVESGL